MKILPAIDLKDGQCVRLVKGDYETAHTLLQGSKTNFRTSLRSWDGSYYRRRYSGKSVAHYTGWFIREN